MSSRHGNSRRQAYGRRMKELRSRRNGELDVDLDGPASWSRGSAWDGDRKMPRLSLAIDRSGQSLRAR